MLVWKNEWDVLEVLLVLKYKNQSIYHHLQVRLTDSKPKLKM